MIYRKQRIRLFFCESEEEGCRGPSVTSLTEALCLMRQSFHPGRPPVSSVAEALTMGAGASPADALCLMRQSLHPTVAETLTIGSRGWPLGAGLWWFVAGLCIDFLGAVLYNSGRFRFEPGFERMFDYG